MGATKNARIFGNRLGLTIAGQDYWSDLAKYELAPSSSDKDVVTFADAASGSTAAWKLKGTAIQSFAPGSFWDKVWTAAGTTIGFILAPHGNKQASATQPHFTGQVKIGVKPSVSSEAGDTKGSTFDFEWDVIDEPEKVATGSTLGTGSQDDE